jgi:hypothetical protein
MTKKELIELLNKADKDAIGFDIGEQGDKKINDKNTALANALLDYLKTSASVDVLGVKYPITFEE